MSGRPLRFLGLVLGGWIAVRTVVLVQSMPGPTPEIARGRALPRPLPARSQPLPPVAWVAAARRLPIAGPVVLLPARAPSFAQPMAPAWQRHPGDPGRVALALLGLTRLGASEPVAEDLRDSEFRAPVTPYRPPAPGAGRLSGSAWLIARGGSGHGQSPLGGQLGGSQAGFRLAYALDRSRRLALVGRVATPLAGAGREAAAGIEWQPTRLPVRLVAEQRIAIDGGGGGPAVGVVGGVGPVPIGDFRLEGYGQAGVIGRERGVAYADGALRIDRAIARYRGATFTAGVGAWGAAQPGAERIDVGPMIAVSLPVERRRVRVALEWRARVGGQAAPGSGLAVSIGGDF